MTFLKWNRFALPPTLFPNKDTVYELLVFEDEKQHFYFFGNTLLWCLGYTQPHIAMQSVVEPEKRLQVTPTNHAIYLDETTSSELIDEKVRQNPDYEPFRDWFTSYLSNCKGSHPADTCPQ